MITKNDYIKLVVEYPENENPGEAIDRWMFKDVPLLGGRVVFARKTQFPVSGEDCCGLWKEQVGKLNSVIALQQIRAGAPMWDGKPFRFCPWCGDPK